MKSMNITGAAKFTGGTSCCIIKTDMSERAGVIERVRSVLENKRLRLRLGATALAPTLVMGLAACFPDRVRNIRDIPADPAFCGGQFLRTGDFSAPYGTVLVDTRCAPDPDKPVIIYGDSERIGGALATAEAGATFETVCYDNGEDIANVAGESSGKWIRVLLDETYTDNSPIERLRPYELDEMAFISATWVNGTDGPEEVWEPCDTELPGNHPGRG